MTQYDKILSLYQNSEWRCQVDFWNIFIRSPHKRRKEMIGMGYQWEERKCEHGVERSKDFRLIKPESRIVEKELAEQKGLFIYKAIEPVWRDAPIKK